MRVDLATTLPAGRCQCGGIHRRMGVRLSGSSSTHVKPSLFVSTYLLARLKIEALWRINWTIPIC